MRKQYILTTALILIAAVGMYGILPQIGNFDKSLAEIKGAQPLNVILAALVAYVGYACAAGIYVLLAYKRIRFGSTYLVQLAGLFVNRIVPAGLGGIGLNFLYLRARKHSVVQATTVVTLNSLVSWIGHMTLLVLVIFLYPAAVTDVFARLPSQQSFFVLLTGLVLLVTALLVLRWSKSERIQSARGTLLKQLNLLKTYYARQPAKLAGALVLACFMTLSSVVSLWLCCLAVGLDVNIYVVFVVYTFGVALGTAVPVPGGLGATEAALIGGFVAQQVSPVVALSAVLLYRLVTFWLGMLVGIGATIAMQSKRLLQTH